MATISLSEDRIKALMDACLPALRRLSKYQLEPALARRLEEMGERKEFLSASEHEELLALVHFAQERNLEKLEAEAGLRRLQAEFPGFVGAS